MLSSAAIAALGVRGIVYGTPVEAGEAEVEAGYSRLDGGSADANDAIVLEVEHSF